MTMTLLWYEVLWYVVAGFLLGFAASTLWEWFYFRKERLKLTDRRIRELEAKVRDLEVAAADEGAPGADWPDAVYRSPGVFLETEAAATRRPARVDVPPPVAAPLSRGQGLAVPSSAPQAPAVAASLRTSVEPPRADGARADGPRTDTSRMDTSRMDAPRPDLTPADALRARRQEALAALRRNSELGGRGPTPLRAESSPTHSGERAMPLGDEETTPFVGGEAALVPPPAGAPPRSPVISSAPVVGAAPAPVTPAPVTPTLAVPTTPSVSALMAPVQAPVQAPVRARWATRAELTRRGAEYPDDLSKIKGIGDSYKHKLYRAGIYTWRQIVEADHAALRRATGANSSTDVEAWVTQARALIEKHGRGEATYGGPLPDDLMKILGIGPVNSATLYRAGVCTYEQLAMMPIADLSALFPVAVAGDQPDFALWVARAAELADAKHGG